MAGPGRPRPPAVPPRARAISNQLLLALAEQWTEQGLASQSERALLTPQDIEVGSSAHLRFITLPRGISALQREVALWQRAAATWQDEATRWLFDPAEVAYAEWRRVETALKQHRLAPRRQESRSWYAVARGLQGRFKGDVAALVEAGGGCTSQLLAYLAQSRTTFPLLSGPVTSRLWLDQLRRIGGVAIEEDEPLCLAPSERAREIAASHALDLAQDPLPVHQVLALEVWAALPQGKRSKILDGLPTS